MWSIGPEWIGQWCLFKASIITLGKDAQTGKGAKHAIEGTRIDTGCLCKLPVASWAIGQLIGNLKLGGNLDEQAD